MNDVSTGRSFLNTVWLWALTGVSIVTVPSMVSAQQVLDLDFDDYSESRLYSKDRLGN